MATYYDPTPSYTNPYGSTSDMGIYTISDLHYIQYYWQDWSFDSVKRQGEYKIYINLCTKSPNGALTIPTNKTFSFFCPQDILYYSDTTRFVGNLQGYDSSTDEWGSGYEYVNLTVLQPTLQYNSSGEARFTYTFTIDLTGVYSAGKEIGVITINGDGYLPPIPPTTPYLLTAPDFTDMDNPTITYSNPFGNNIASLMACITLPKAGQTDRDDIKYRDIPKTGTSYTFNLTEAERNVIRNATLSGSNSRVARFIIQAITADGTVHRHKIDKTVTIIDCGPVLYPVIKDVGNISKTLTRNQDVIIKGYNTIEFDIGAVANKGASIVSQKITCGGFSSTAATGKFSHVESGTFVVTATDNRGNTVSKTITKELINYFKPTCNQKVELAIEETDGSTIRGTINISGKFFYDKFGAAGVDNNLQVYFRHTDHDGNMGEWINVADILAEVYKDSTKSTYVVEFSSGDFLQENAYTFQAKVVDSINEVESSTYTTRLKPVFDWGETDFNFNVQELKMDEITVIRKNPNTNSLIFSTEATAGGMYLRPNGTHSEDGQVYLDKGGGIIFFGTSIGLNGTPALTRGDNNNLVISTEGSSGGIYIRPNGSTSETGQMRILTDGSVMFNGSKMADFITEQGTSGIWTWEKWASGKAVCYGTVTDIYQTEDGTTSIYDNVKTAYSIRRANFPFTFTGVPKVFTTANDSGTGVVTASNDGSTASYCNVVVWGNGSSLGGINVMAVGRWK